MSTTDFWDDTHRYTPWWEAFYDNDLPEIKRDIKEIIETLNEIKERIKNENP